MVFFAGLAAGLLVVLGTARGVGGETCAGFDAGGLAGAGVDDAATEDRGTDCVCAATGFAADGLVAGFMRNRWPR